jgi:predicted XRE-type DNA-binding protein
VVSLEIEDNQNIATKLVIAVKKLLVPQALKQKARSLVIAIE